jgi:predicted transcriptional regulator
MRTIMDRQTRVSNQALAQCRELTPQLSGLGPLEKEIMNVMWTGEPTNVRGVVSRMDRKLAYTTVMTTLARLCRKGFLDRSMADRAFVYSVRVSYEDWRLIEGYELIEGLLIKSPYRSLLLSYLVDVVGTHDGALLDELDAKIQRKREELTNENRAPALAIAFEDDE